MFTLKLYRRRANPFDPETLITSVHHVRTLWIGDRTVELHAYDAGASGGDYVTYYLGERKADYTAINDDNHWDWGLLENMAGQTSQHFRPHTYG